MAQLPDLGRLALRPSVVSTGVAGQGKKQKTDDPKRDLRELWAFIIDKVFAFQDLGGKDFLRAFMGVLNAEHPGLITPPPDLRVDFQVLGLPTPQANMRKAREVISATYVALTKKRREEGKSILRRAKKARVAPDPSLLERQRNAMRSTHMEDDRNDDAQGHFADAERFEDPPPPPDPRDEPFDDAQRRMDRIRKWPPALDGLVDKRDADGRRCCATDARMQRLL